MNKYYVYLHRNPINNSPFYIGKGTGDRAFERRARSSEWLNIVKDIKAKGLTYTIEIIHICATENEAFEIEKIEINKYAHLVNIRDNYTEVKESTQSNFEKELKELGRQIKHARIEQSIKAADLARSVRINRATLRKMENGECFNSEIGLILNVLKKLGLSFTFPIETQSKKTVL